MSINVSVPPTHELKPRITVIGVGGAGCNAVNNMIASHLEGVEFIVSNTDAQSIANSMTEVRVQLGANVTQGLGSGAKPEVGKAAADESIDQVLEHIEGTHMLFVTAGMGGGTGTGAAPVIAQAAKDKGILTVGVVTKPFHFEGKHRMRVAEKGIVELESVVDTLIVIPNQNLFKVANAQTTFADAFKMADKVLYSGVRGVTDLMVMPGLINLDFADVRSVMMEMGKAMMGTGEAEGDNRALDAAAAAISNPLLDDVSLTGARGVLVNITGGPDLTLFEVDEIVDHIRQQSDDEVNLIFGATTDEEMTNNIRVSIVATGIGVSKEERDPVESLVRPLNPLGTTPIGNITENMSRIDEGPIEDKREELVSENIQPNIELAETDSDVAHLEKEHIEEIKLTEDRMENDFIPPEAETIETKSVISEEQMSEEVDHFTEEELLNDSKSTNESEEENNKEVIEEKIEEIEKVKKEEKPGLIKRIASGSVFSSQARDKIKSEKTMLRAESKPFFSGLKTEEQKGIEGNKSEQPSKKILTEEKIQEDENMEDNLTDIPAFLRRQND